MAEKIRIFISNAGEDCETAKRVYADLKNAGITPWLEEEDLLVGSNREFKIREAIKSSRFFLALLSSHSVTERGIVQKKLKSALDILKEFPEDDIFIIPVRIDDCIPPLNLSEIHTADLFPSYDAGFQKILKTIESVPVSSQSTLPVPLTENNEPEAFEKIATDADGDNGKEENGETNGSQPEAHEPQTHDYDHTPKNLAEEIPGQAKLFAGIFFTLVSLSFLLIISRLSFLSAHDMPTNMQLVNINAIAVSSSLIIVLYLMRFYVINTRQLESDAALENEYDWLVWPAIGLNKLFVFLYGKSSTRMKELITWRSAFVTLLISASANLACIYIIFSYEPKDLPPFSLEEIKVLFYSHLVFLIFNFFGDWVSVTITRYTVANVITKKFKLLKYLAIDMFGIALGYGITLSPTVFVTVYCLLFEDNLNSWIHTGLLGNALIPFFLMIFATTNMPVVFTVFAIVAVFSVTIPSAVYLCLILFCFFFYKFHRHIWRCRDIKLTDAELIRMSLPFRLLNFSISGLKIFLFAAIVSEIISKNLF